MSADSRRQEVEKEMKKLPAGVSDFDNPVSVEPKTSGKLMWRRRGWEMSLWKGGSHRESCTSFGCRRDSTKKGWRRSWLLIFLIEWLRSGLGTASSPTRPPLPGQRRCHWDVTHACTYLPSGQKLLFSSENTFCLVFQRRAQCEHVPARTE